MTSMERLGAFDRTGERSGRCREQAQPIANEVKRRPLSVSVGDQLTGSAHNHRQQTRRIAEDRQHHEDRQKLFCCGGVRVFLRDHPAGRWAL